MSTASVDGRSRTMTGAVDQQAMMNRLMKFPLILYRMGLGPLMAKWIVVLSTRGRRTGLWRYIPVGYVRDGERFYVFSARGDQADWYRNLQQNRDAALHIGNWRFAARADFVSDLGELKAVTETLKKTFPAFEETARNMMGIDINTDEGVARLRMVRFTPTGYPPQDSFTPDLLWTWLIIVPVALVLLRQIMKRPKVLMALLGQAMPVIVWLVRQYMRQRQEGAGRVIEGVVEEA